MEDCLTVDIREVSQLANNAGNLVFTREAEEELLKLLKVQKDVNEFVEKVKEKIMATGESIAPNFRGVVGERIRCICRVYGGKYTFAKEMAHVVQPFLDVVSYQKVDTAKVEKYLEDNGVLPDGVMAKDRERKLSIVVGDEEVED